MFDDKVQKRFWEKVNRSGGPDACWEWTGARTSNGYGCFTLNGRSLGAHRVVLLLGGVEIPDGYHACHSCDNPPCVNPKHLSPKPPSENTREAIERGLRQPMPPGWVYRRGSDHHKAVLVEADALSIRALYASGDYTMQHLGDRFGVSAVTIWSIVHRVNWKHV